MAKVSPHVRSFNAGEFSELLEGRTDLDRYPASLRSAYNYIAAPQGPAIGRSGTAFVSPASRHDEVSVLMPFVFSDDQAKTLEFASDRIRFLDEDGIQVYPPVADVNVTSDAGELIVFASDDLDAEVGDDVVLLGLPAQYNMNGEIARITDKTGNIYTLDMSYTDDVAVEDFEAARVYHVDCVYTEDQRQSLRYVQSVDVVYLLTRKQRTRKLSRYDDYDWRIEELQFVDGPYLPVNETPTKLTPSATGNAVPIMTADNAPSGTCSGSSVRSAVAADAKFLGRTIPYALTASQYWYAFDADNDTYWAANISQKGYIQYTPAAAFVCDGYTIYAAKDNQDGTYTAKEYAPSSWTFEGYDGTNWNVLDTQEDYVLYDNSKSVFFTLANDTAYQAYRLNISKLVANGSIEPRVRRLTMRSAAEVTFTLTASSTVGINRDKGFQASDVGRLIRVKGSDGAWRSCEIKTVTDTTHVDVTLLGEPLPDLKAIRDWRMGYWSDTTGWPSVGDFYEDRLFLAGCDEYPDMFAGSVTGAYETFSQTDTYGEVLDDSAIVSRLNSRKLSRVLWLSSDDKGMLLGTGSEEYALTTPSNEPMTPRNVKARPATRRGSADVEPVRVDSQVLFVQRGGRTVREFAYVFEADGYKSPSMSQLASHFGVEPFVEMDYAAEPHSIVWMRRANGSLVGMTYNREENVVGWHKHELSGGIVESITVVPQKDGMQDALWCSVKRTINGQTRRYIERLTRFWDFTTDLSVAHFVDCGLRYTGTPIETVYGLQHLEGEEVYGLADTRPVGPFTVTNGSVKLPYAASNVVIGLGFESVAETSRLENGAADGTAMGKVKRINLIVPHVWRSSGGEIGVYNTEEKGPIYEPLVYPGDNSEIEEIELYTGELDAITPAPGYEKRGSLFFRRPKRSPLPFNVIAMMPQLTTQDR